MLMKVCVWSDNKTNDTGSYRTSNPLCYRMAATRITQQLDNDQDEGNIIYIKFCNALDVPDNNSRKCATYRKMHTQHNFKASYDDDYCYWLSFI